MAVRGKFGQRHRGNGLGRVPPSAASSEDWLAVAPRRQMLVIDACR